METMIYLNNKYELIILIVFSNCLLFFSVRNHFASCDPAVSQSDQSQTSIYAILHRGSDNSPLLIVFSANYIDQSIVTFMGLKVG